MTAQQSNRENKIIEGGTVKERRWTSLVSKWREKRAQFEGSVVGESILTTSEFRDGVGL